ncbi:MAG: ABC transporter permease [Proteobacteria bacterium]|nr:ABC transporter permease [Pseudomonadota bacterium]
MTTVEILSQAARTLRAQRMRSLLTLFGLVWGTASVIFLMGWGEGVRVMLERGFFKTGRNVGQIWAGRIGEEFTPASDRRYLWFRMEDVETLRRRARIPDLVGAQAMEILPGSFGQRSMNVDVRGIEPEVMAIRGVPLAAGRGISRADVEHRRHVVVLGDTVRRRLLGSRAELGARVRIGGKPFKVVGLLEHVGTQLARDRLEIDEQVWMPVTTLRSNWPAWWTSDVVVNTILYRIPDRRLLEDSKREARGILARRLRVSPSDEEAIGIFSSLEMMNRMPMDQTKGFLFILAVTTLVIGGVGTLNMMLDAVHERRGEIGLRLAVGARRRDVVTQFFLETLAITGFGGAVGVGLGIASCRLLGQFEVPDLVPVPILQWPVVVTAVFILVGVGLVAGIVPAVRAARVDPALTLRAE